VNYGWEYWRLNRIDDGSLQWLAISRPEARAVIERSKVWTLIPDRRIFLANWIVTEDHHRQEEPGVWVHENIDIDESREVALEVPQVSPEDLTRILRPVRCLSLDQLDRIRRTKSSEFELLGSCVANNPQLLRMPQYLRYRWSCRTPTSRFATTWPTQKVRTPLPRPCNTCGSF